MKKLLSAVSAFSVALALACDGGPQAGELVLELATVSEQLGAVSFTVTAGEPNTIDTLTAACSGCQLFTVRRSEREIRGVITGQIGAGPLVRAAVSDVTTPISYGGVVIEAAAPDFQLVAISGTRLVILQQ